MTVWKATLLLLAGTCAVQGQHLHLNAGATNTRAGTPLYFANADTFTASSGYVLNMVLRTNGPAAGLYDGGITFTALGSDGFEGPPAAPGSQLALVIKSVTGPADSLWSFWESDACEDFGCCLTFSVPTGVTNGANTFLLSQNLGLPGDDPYGHCHGRRYTASKPGLHTVGVQIVDVSSNGPAGGPIHTPSPIYYLHWQAGITIANLARTNQRSTATFGTRNGSTYWLEAADGLSITNQWTTVAGPVSGNNRLRALIDENAAVSQRFYRLRVTTP